ncbi:MAG: DNA polymerase III subunit gamma/tau [Myxococcaceae bacterium]|nr:DNA polymerase III subunit gamma/tau [Myxococcaceae bacterium]MBH2006760.1 DNA polymerase III subunit gamma/tau [Myxococcaceae bacterium]
MNYLVLARKWRPQRFSEVVGQEVIVKTLSAALTSGRIAHAFLLTGSRGVGKTTVARLLAKALSCEKGMSPDPCGVCSVCQDIAAGSSIDVIEIDGASNTGVDDIRELRENVRYQPARARFKVFIIDEVHMLSSSAFNALLKTLEEPPAHVKFIFATTEAHKIPITILSRCQRYDFKRMAVSTIVSHLKSILEKESLQMDDAGLMLMAENADGGMRDALSLLDQVLSFSGTSASLQDVTEILGLMDQQAILKASNAILEAKPREALAVIETASSAGFDLRQLANGVATEFRHLCISKAAGSIQNLADLTKERVDQIDETARLHDAFDLQRLFKMALEGIHEMGLSERPKMQLELAFVRMAGRPQLSQLSEVQEAIARLEKLGQVLPQPTQKAKKSSWQDFVKHLGQKMPMVAHHLEHARLLANGKMEFDQKLHFTRIQEACQESEFRQLFQEAFDQLPSAVLSESIHVARETQAKRDQESLEEQARNHPTVQRALSIFGGEIKAVKKDA